MARQIPGIAEALSIFGYDEPRLGEGMALSGRGFVASCGPKAGVR